MTFCFFVQAEVCLAQARKDWMSVFVPADWFNGLYIGSDGRECAISYIDGLKAAGYGVKPDVDSGGFWVSVPREQPLLRYLAPCEDVPFTIGNFNPNENHHFPVGANRTFTNLNEPYGHVMTGGDASCRKLAQAPIGNWDNTGLHLYVDPIQINPKECGGVRNGAWVAPIVISDQAPKNRAAGAPCSFVSIYDVDLGGGMTLSRPDGWSPHQCSGPPAISASVGAPSADVGSVTVSGGGWGSRIRFGAQVFAGGAIGVAGGWAGRRSAKGLGYSDYYANKGGDFLGSELASGVICGFSGPGIVIGGAIAAVADVASENHGWEGSRTKEVLDGLQAMENRRGFIPGGEMSARPRSWADFFSGYVPESLGGGWSGW
jgi:hypothetical protein